MQTRNNVDKSGTLPQTSVLILASLNKYFCSLYMPCRASPSHTHMCRVHVKLPCTKQLTADIQTLTVLVWYVYRRTWLVYTVCAYTVCTVCTCTYMVMLFELCVLHIHSLVMTGGGIYYVLRVCMWTLSKLMYSLSHVQT